MVPTRVQFWRCSLSMNLAARVRQTASSPRPSPPEEEREKTPEHSTFGASMLELFCRNLPMKRNGKRTVSPLTPALSPLRGEGEPLDWFAADEQRQFAPFPIAIGIAKTNLPQPAKLRLHVQKLVGRVLVGSGDAEGLEKSLVDLTIG